MKQTAYKLQVHCKIVSVRFTMLCQTISGNITLELVRYLQVTLPVGVQVPDNNDRGHEA